MNALMMIMIAGAGGVGAGLRFLVDSAVSARLAGQSLPWGTAVINLSGSLVLGLITGAAQGWGWPILGREVIGTGLLGGYTTLSAASVQSVQLIIERRALAALINGFGLGLACVLMAGLGLVIGRLLT